MAGVGKTTLAVQWAQRAGAVDPDTGSEVEHRARERAAGAWLLTQVTGLGNRERDVLRARARGLSTAETANALQITYKSGVGRAPADAERLHPGPQPAALPLPPGNGPLTRRRSRPIEAIGRDPLLWS